MSPSDSNSACTTYVHKTFLCKIASPHKQNYSLLTAVRSMLWKNANDCLLRQTSSPPPVMTTRCRVDNLTAHSWITLVHGLLYKKRLIATNHRSLVHRRMRSPRLMMKPSCTKGTSTQLGGSLSLETCRPGPSLCSEKNRQHRWIVASETNKINSAMTLRMVMVP